MTLKISFAAMVSSACNGIRNVEAKDAIAMINDSKLMILGI